MAYPEPANVSPWYLRNITQALELNEVTGQVFVRTNAALIGNVTVGNVAIGALGNVDISGNTMPVSGNVTVYQGTIPWAIGNTNVVITSGNVAVTGNVGINGNLAGITANVTVVDGGGSLTVDGNVNASITGTANVALGGTNLDAFGRLRISNPVTLFDSQNMYIDGGQFSNVTATGGNITYVANESSFNLSVTAANGSSVISQAKTTQPYQPGKSLLSLNSFCFAALATGCRQRVGYFTDNNGVYFEADGEDLYLVIRSKASGTIQEERILQANWNTDTLSGVGGSSNPSGIELNPALVNIFWCDIEWLGVGSVRAGFVIDGNFIVCHKFNHANVAGNTTVYMTSATLNPRYEITNTAATSGARIMKQICSTVISEGGYTPSPTIAYLSSGIQPQRIATGNVYTNLATIRLNPATPDAVVTPGQIDLLLTDVQYGAFQLVVGASNVAGLTYANVNGGIVQANTSPVQIGDGTVVYAGVTSSRDSFTVGDDVARRLQLGRYANGTPITLTLCVGYGSNNADVIWKFGWEEQTS